MNDYLQHVLMNDTAVMKGNLALMRGLRLYLHNQRSRLERQTTIVVLDVGPAIGALTTLLLLQELGGVGLLKKTRVVLWDVSERVIERTREVDFRFPAMLIRPEFETAIRAKLRNAKGVVGSLGDNSSFHQDTPSQFSSSSSVHERMNASLTDGAKFLKPNSIDIAVAGFLFSYLHESVKKPAAETLQRVTAPGGFVGVVDREEPPIHTQDDDWPKAEQSPVSYRKLRGMFRELAIFESQKSGDYYAFSGMVKGSRRGDI